MNPEIAAVLSGESRWCVVQGDCLDVLKTLPEGCMDAVVTDPPYGIANTAARARPTTGQRLRGQRPREWDTVPARGVVELVDLAPAVVIWGGNYYALPVSRGWLAWYKPDAPPSMASVELAWTSSDVNARFISHSIAATNQERCGHPTQKPIRVMQWTLGMLNLAPAALVIVDPFCGSGTTGVAAIMEGRRFIGIELEASYIKIAKRRIADAAAQTTLFANGTA